MNYLKVSSLQSIVLFATMIVVIFLASCASGRYPKPHKRAPVGGWPKKYDSNPGGFHPSSGKVTPF